MGKKTIYMALNISVADANALNSNDKVLTGTQNYNSNIDGLKCGNASIIYLYGYISILFWYVAATAASMGQFSALDAYHC